MPSFLELIGISFGYDAAGTVLFDNLTLRFPPGWTGIIGPNGAGKTTLLHLVAGRLSPRRGRVLGAGDVVVCPQRTDDPPDDLASLVDATASDARRLRGQLGIETGWAERWGTLSHGERKRAQIGAALWRRPDVLALDEPTNHVDGETRDLLYRLLATFRGVGLLVSHDRALLDGLCGQCVFIEAGMAQARPGGYTDASAQVELDEATTQRARDRLRKEQQRLDRVADTRREEAAQADRKRSKRKLGRKDHDAKSRIDAARVSGKDGQAGRLLSQLDGRLRQGDDKLRSMQVRKRRVLGLTMRGVESRRAVLWQTAAVEVPLGADRTLVLPELVVRPADRIGIRGPNGAGKSTLVRRIVETLELSPEQVVHLPQEIDRVESGTLLASLRQVPSARRGAVLAAVNCLGSDPERLVETDELSPGEVRKLILALGLAREPNLIIMDEPTNHLDLPSIECLEHALRECRCAMLLVSHDEAFLGSLVRTWWTMTPAPDGMSRCGVEPNDPAGG